MDDKICKKCKVKKSISLFNPHPKSKDRLAYECKECWNTMCKNYRERNPEKIKEVNRSQYLNKREERIKAANDWKNKNPIKAKEIKTEFKKRNPEYSRFLTIKKYGLSFEEFESMLSKYDNSCWICKKEFESRQDAKIDHCHSRNVVRGVLCNDCNIALGLVKDNIKILSEMITYLKKY